MDLFGLAIKQFFEGKKVSLIIERDDGLISIEDIPKYFSSFEHWNRCERLAILYARGRVLDIGCGPGRHSIYLINRGYEVYSIDISYYVLQVGYSKGLTNPVLMNLMNLGFRQGVFDTILLLGGGIGLAGKLEDIEKFLYELHEVASDNGILIISSRDPYKTKDYRHIKYHLRNMRLGIYPGTIKIRFRFGETFGNWFYYTLIDTKTLDFICQKAKWRILKVFEDEGSDAYSAVVMKY